MSSTLRIKPFGLSEDGEYIDDFDDMEMDEILDLFESLAEKCTDTFNNLEKVTVEMDPENKGVLIINYIINDGDDLSDDDFLFYVESLTGHNSNNIIEIGDINYEIMGEPVEETSDQKKDKPDQKKDKPDQKKDKPDQKKDKPDQDFLDKMTKLERVIKSI